MVMNYSFRELYYDWINPFLIAICITFLFMTVILIATKEIHGVELLWLKWI